MYFFKLSCEGEVYLTLPVTLSMLRALKYFEFSRSLGVMTRIPIYDFSESQVISCITNLVPEQLTYKINTGVGLCKEYCM